MLYNIANGNQDDLYNEILQNFKFMIDMYSWFDGIGFTFPNNETLRRSISENYGRFRDSVDAGVNSVSTPEQVIDLNAFRTIREIIPYSYQTVNYILDNVPETYAATCYYQYVYVRLMPNDMITREALFTDSFPNVSAVVKFENSIQYTIGIISGLTYESVPNLIIGAKIANIMAYNQAVINITTDRVPAPNSRVISPRFSSSSGLDEYRTALG